MRIAKLIYVAIQFGSNLASLNDFITQIGHPRIVDVPLRATVCKNQTVRDSEGHKILRFSDILSISMVEMTL